MPTLDWIGKKAVLTHHREVPYGPEVGDCWCFVALERTTKLVLTWHVGKRTPQDILWLAAKLR